MKKSTVVASLILASSLTYAFDLGSITKSVMDSVTNGTENTATKTNTTNSNLDRLLRVSSRLWIWAMIMSETRASQKTSTQRLLWRWQISLPKWFRKYLG